MDVFRICLLITHVAVSAKARLDVNVALNRPSYQGSDWEDNPASNANDGSHSTDEINLRCAISGVATNPWWAVDLGVALYVFGVKFTNRVSAVTAPTLWNYAVCGQYPGAVGSGATVTLTCTTDMPPYRYLIVQFPSTGTNGNFCELDVYIRRWDWVSRRKQKMINNVASTITVDIRLQCMLNCTFSPVCDSYNYRPSDKTCELNTHDTPLNASSTDIVVDNDWTWWSPNFCNVV